MNIHFNRAAMLVVFATLLLLAACGGGGGSDPVSAPEDDSGPDLVNTDPDEPIEVELVEAFSGASFNQPVALLQIPTANQRWLVVERAGVIIEINADGVEQREFINISGIVNSNANEAGLLGFTLHPDFSSNGQAFLSYTKTSGSGIESVIARFSSDDGGLTLNPASEEILITVIQDFGNHNGGQIAFSADGFLYVGWGDGGSGDDPNNRAQDNTNLMGTFSRIDVDSEQPYGIPNDNPFAGNALCAQGFGGADCPEIFAWGLRNPWRWSFDSVSGELWAGDVGQGRFEEVNEIALGNNYGWRIREGSECNIPSSGCQTDDLIDPWFDYAHDQGQSITGGYVYHGDDLSGLDSYFVFGDFVSGRIWAVATFGTTTDPATFVPDNLELLDTGLSISSFAQDNDGELYVLDYTSGQIHQLQ